MNLFEDFKVNISFRTIAFLNSGAFSYFENHFDSNVMLAGGNNVGKTTLLNSLQLMLFPQVNLKNIEKKFFIRGKNKSYTDEETYKYYFPDEYSYVIIEVVRDHEVFCAVMFGKSKSEKEYGRILVRAAYNDIRHFFFDEETESPAKDILQKELFKNLQEYVISKTISSGYKELKNINDVQDYFYKTKIDGKENPFVVVPISQSDTNVSKAIDNFTSAFKALYNSAGFDQAHKCEIIAELVEKQRESDRIGKKLLEFNVSKSQESYNEIKDEELQILSLQSQEKQFAKLSEIIHQLPKDTITQQNYLFSAIKSSLLLSGQLKDKQREIIDSLEKMHTGMKEYEETAITKQKEKELALREKTIAETNMSSYEKEIRSIFNSVKNAGNQFVVSSEDSIEKLIKVINENKQDLVKYLNDEIDGIAKRISNNNILISASSYSTLAEKEAFVAKLKRLKISLKTEIDDITSRIAQTTLLGHNSDLFDQETLVKLNALFSFDLLSTPSTSLTTSTIKILEQLTEKATISQDNFLIIDDAKIKIKSDLSTDLKQLLVTSKEAKLEELRSISKQLEVLDGTVVATNYEVENKLLKDQQNKFEISKSSLHTIVERFYSDYSQQSQKLKVATDSYLLLDSDLQSIKTGLTDIRKKESELKLNQIAISSKIKTAESVYNRLYIMVEQEDYKLIENEVKVDENVDPGEYERLYLNKSQAIQENRQDAVKLIRGFIDFKIIDAAPSKLLALNSSVTEQESLDEFFNLIAEKYHGLQQRQGMLVGRTQQFEMELSNDLDGLRALFNSIKSVERDINRHFEGLKISNLNAVEFEVVVDKSIQNIIKTFYEGIDRSYGNKENISDVLKSLIANIKNNKGIITAKDLILEVNYKTQLRSDGKFTTISQSNGTELSITVSFLTYLLKNLYDKNYVLRLPIPVDEIGAVDVGNTQSLIKAINDNNLVIVTATPNLTGNQSTLIGRVIRFAGYQSRSYLNEARKLMVSDRLSPLGNIVIKQKND